MQDLFGGQRVHHIAIANGDHVTVAEQGAQVLSWVSAGRERLYLSQANAWDGKSAIRGGVPLCFPQFNQRGPLPKHGFARNLSWTLREQPVQQEAYAALCMTLQASDASRALWPHDFVFELQVVLTPGQLHMTLQATNTGPEPWSFTGALHTYLAVDDVARTTLQGLQGQSEWDALRDSTAPAADTLTFGPEFDRVYTATPAPLLVRDGTHALHITQSPSWVNTVVWNPGPHKNLTDMAPGDHAHMLCVEAAQVFTPVQVAPGQTWRGWQQLRVTSDHALEGE